MKMFNDLAKKISEHHASAKKPMPTSMGAPEASSEPAEHSNAGAIEAMHSELADKICPDCHTSVKAALAKHGMHSGSAAASGLASHPAVSGE